MRYVQDTQHHIIPTDSMSVAESSDVPLEPWQPDAHATTKSSYPHRRGPSRSILDSLATSASVSPTHSIRSERSEIDHIQAESAIERDRDRTIDTPQRTGSAFSQHSVSEQAGTPVPPVDGSSTAIGSNRLQSSKSNVALSSGAEALAEVVSSLWSCYEHELVDGEQIVTEGAYTQMYIRLANVLYQHVEHQEALRSARTDWMRDTAESMGRMNLATYTRSILEVAKQWTQDADWTIQAAFLRNVFTKLSAQSTTGGIALKQQPKQKPSQLDKLHDLWRSKYGSPRKDSTDGSTLTTKQTCTDTELRTRQRLERRRIRRSDADARVNTRGAKVYTHTEDHAENMTLKSLQASGPGSTAITLYTPWQPTWEEGQMNDWPREYKDWAPPQTEPVYQIRSRQETERAIARQQREHLLDQQWRAAMSIRPQSAREHIQSGIGKGELRVKQQGVLTTDKGIVSANPEAATSTAASAAKPPLTVGSTSLPQHASATGTTHLSFIPFSVPTFPIAAGSSTTTRERSSMPSPHLHAELQPTPPVPARVRPHSAAATRMKHVWGHRKFVRELTSTHKTTQQIFQQMMPQQEDELQRVSGPLVAFPKEALDDTKDASKTDNQPAELVSLSLPTRPMIPSGDDDSHHPSLQHDDGTGSFRAAAAGHVHSIGFRSRDAFIRRLSDAGVVQAGISEDGTPITHRPKSAIQRNQLSRSKALILPDTTGTVGHERLLLLMSGREAETPYVKSQQQEEKESSPVPQEKRPVSAHLAHTLAHLAESSAATRRGSVGVPVGTNGARRFTTTAAGNYAHQQAREKHQLEQQQQQAAAVEQPVQDATINQSTTSADDPDLDHPLVSSSHTKDETFLTSVGLEYDGDVASSAGVGDLSGTNALFAEYVMPSRARREGIEEQQQQEREGQESTAAAGSATVAPEDAPIMEEQRLILHSSLSSLASSSSTLSSAALNESEKDRQANSAPLLPYVPFVPPAEREQRVQPLDPSILQAHPTLGLACVTIPPRAPASWHPKGHTLHSRLVSVSQSAEEKSTKSWSWFERLCTGPEPLEEEVRARTLIPAPGSSTAELDRIRRNELRKSIFNPRAPEAEWLVPVGDGGEGEYGVEEESKQQPITSITPYLARPAIPSLSFDRLPAGQVPSRVSMPGSAEIRERKVQERLREEQRMREQMEMQLQQTQPSPEQKDARITDTQSSVPLLLSVSTPSTSVSSSLPSSATRTTYSSAYTPNPWQCACELTVVRQAGESRVREQLVTQRTMHERMKNRPRAIRPKGVAQRPQTARPSGTSTSNPHDHWAHRYHAHNAQSMRGYIVPAAPLDFRASRPAVVSTPADAMPPTGEPVLTAMAIDFPAPLSVLRISTSPQEWWSGRGKATIGRGSICKNKGMVERPHPPTPAGTGSGSASKSGEQNLELSGKAAGMNTSKANGPSSMSPAKSSPLPPHSELYDSEGSLTTDPSAGTSAFVSSADVTPAQSRPQSAYTSHGSVSGVAQSQRAFSAVPRVQSSVQPMPPQPSDSHESMSIRDEEGEGLDEEDAGDSTSAHPASFAANRVAAGRPVLAHASAIRPCTAAAKSPAPVSAVKVSIGGGRATSAVSGSTSRIANPPTSGAPAGSISRRASKIVAGSTAITIPGTLRQTSGNATSGRLADMHTDDIDAIGAWQTASDDPLDAIHAPLSIIHIPTVPVTATPKDFLTV